MGMIVTKIATVPEGKTLTQYLGEVSARATAEADEEHYEGVITEAVTLDNFEEVWEGQENIKKDAKDKYRERARAGRLIYVEFDV